MGEADFVQKLTAAQSRLYAYILTLLGHTRDAADVLQETNGVLWAKLNEYDASRPFLPWAYRFAQMQVMAHRKKLSRDRLLFDDAMLDLIASEYARQDAGDRQLDALEDCLEGLTVQQRTILDRRYTQGISVNAIARDDRSDPNAVSAMLYRIRNLLAECIEHKLAGEPS